ncbi:hypothetical protein QTP88_018826 [Uroleucon formosanum]
MKEQVYAKEVNNRNELLMRINNVADIIRQTPNLLNKTWGSLHRRMEKNFQMKLNKKSFEKLVKFYLDTGVHIVITELKVWHSKLRKIDKFNKTAKDALRLCNFEIFPNIYQLLKILCTLPVSTSTPKRRFSSCKRKAEEDLHNRQKKIIMEEICKTPALNTNIIDVQRIKKNIYEKRKKILPANPNNLAGVHKALNDTKPVTKEDPHEVSEYFVNDFMSDCPDDKRLKKYCDYLTENFIKEESLFPPQYWAVVWPSLVRTTNACESFHSFFNQCFYKHTPPIMSWLAVLINEVQTDVYIKIRSINILKTPRDTKNVERQRQNEAYIEDYKNNKICRYKFVKQISYNYKT